MILMALDHVRDFFGIPGQNPTNLAATTVPLFFTRWITHFCAPVFFLLMGTGAFLSGTRKTKRELSWFLFTRGVWLIALELTVVRCLGFQFNFDYQVTLLVVLWALGWALIALSALVWLPLPTVIAVGIALIAGHNAFDFVRSDNPFWIILHSPGFVINQPGFAVFVSYPIIPWIGVTAAGYGLGQIYQWPAPQRRSLLLRLGVAMMLAFLLLRATNIYGDPRDWSVQSRPVFTALSFLNTNKYPPSLLFLLMTLGPALLFLRAVDGGTPRVLRPALVFGKVPMFYFLLHLPLIHLLVVIVCYVRYGTAHWMFESPTLAQYPFTAPPGWGYSLLIVYLIWALVVIALYPACRWYAALKQRRPDSPWLRYL